MPEELKKFPRSNERQGECKVDLVQIERQTAAALEEVFAASNIKRGQLFVVGCSTSEVIGETIGTSGSEEVAAAIMGAMIAAADAVGVYLAVQCCEHLNRALVVERSAAERYRLEEVAVVPAPKAGGAAAARAMRDFKDPVVAETIAAHAGLDIGATLIGMHLRPVAVPVRLKTPRIGQASLTAARTRPKFIGGSRAVYEFQLHSK